MSTSITVPRRMGGKKKKKTLALMALFIKHRDPAALQRLGDGECFLCVRSPVLSFM